MIDAFIKLMEDDSKNIDIKELFKNKKELIEWEKMVHVFETIQIDNVSEGLKEINLKYKLNRQEELMILAYVKFLELMVYKVSLAKDIVMKDKSDDESTTKAKSYSGSMYG